MTVDMFSFNHYLIPTMKNSAECSNSPDSNDKKRRLPACLLSTYAANGASSAPSPLTPVRIKYFKFDNITVNAFSKILIYLDN